MSSINRRAVKARARIISTRKIGSYFHLVLAVAHVAEHCKPGNFVAIAVGGPTSSMLLHRVFAIYRARIDANLGSIIELIVAPSGKGSDWLVNQPEGSEVDLTGPLGNSFPIPVEPVNVAIIGGGYGAAPLFDLAEQLKAKGCRINAIIGASTAAKVFAPLDGKRTVNSMTVTTEDGSAGVEGRVTDVLPDLIESQRIDLVYSCGPMPMLKAVDAITRRFNVAHQVSVEEAMACGIGICMTCVIPIFESGESKLVRSCIEGPVLSGDLIDWAGGER